MTEPYYSDDTLTLLLGDAREVLATMPDESVDCVVTSPPYFGLRDFAGRHEMLFLLTKSPRYWFDLDAIRVPHAESTIAAARRARRPYTAPGQRPNTKSRPLGDKGANPGDVWSINTRPLTEAHFATFPVELPRRCIMAGCKPGGTVLDPFSGAGTTALAAQQLGRRAIGIDINAKYHDIALKRMSDAPLPFGGDAA